MPPAQDCLEERGIGRRKEYGTLQHDSNDGPSMDSSMSNGLNLQYGTAAAHQREILGRRGTAGVLKRGITSSGSTWGPSALCAPASSSASSRRLLNSTPGSRRHSTGASSAIGAFSSPMQPRPASPLQSGRPLGGSACAGLPLVVPPGCTSSQDEANAECGQPEGLEAAPVATAP